MLQLNTLLHTHAHNICTDEEAPLDGLLLILILWSMDCVVLNCKHSLTHTSKRLGENRQIDDNMYDGGVVVGGEVT